MKKENTVSYSMDEIKKMKDRSREDEGIDFSDIPKLDGDFWENAKVVFPEAPKKQLTLRLDADMVEWFKKQGKGYQTRMNTVLRSYYETCKNMQQKP